MTVRFKNKSAQHMCVFVCVLQPVRQWKWWCVGEVREYACWRALFLFSYVCVLFNSKKKKIMRG
jgi:hypothetical protein